MAQETGILIQWLKQEGDTITQGEPLMEVETDKATVEVEAPASGQLVNITAKPGDAVPVGQPIAFILAEGETAPTPASTPVAAQAAAPTSPAEKVRATPLAQRVAADHNVDLADVSVAGERIRQADVLAHLQASPVSRPVNGRTLASPKARRLAQENNLDLAAILGSGPEGAVLAADVLAAAAAATATVTVTPAIAAPPAATATETVSVSRTWQVMAQRLTQSWTTVPHFYLAAEANATALSTWRTRAQARSEVKLTFTDLLVKLVAMALRKHPRLNAKWEGESIILNPAINIGLAVAIEAGLVVPVVQQADQLGLTNIATQRASLITRAQSGKLSLDDLSDGTFTISNLGMYGIDAFNAIVNPPQAAILAVGRIADRVVALNGQPAVQPMLTLTLSCDHRVVDGARAAQFLQTLVGFIEDPLSLLD
jgi:pyruvate dehydrogenase E2 component (dihydrolipoamide acetyltransferase)